MPTVTVLMPVFNAEQYLREAIDSILAQTLGDFEFIVIDDGSMDRSAAIVASYTDARIRLLKNGTNRGMAYSLNCGLAAATGAYIARMDADDIALPKRLQRQTRFLESHPEIGLVGSWYQRFGSAAGTVRTHRDHERLKASLLFNSPFGHPTVMFRTGTIRRLPARYEHALFPADDWALWAALANDVRFANVPEVLLRYRVHPSSATGGSGALLRTDAPMIRAARAIYSRLLPQIGIEPTEEDLDLHTSLCFSLSGHEANLIAAERWLRRLCIANRRAKVFSATALGEVVGWMWLRTNFHRAGPFARKIERWMNSPLCVRSLRAVFQNPRAVLESFRARRAFVSQQPSA